eukprot:6006417-Pyramimonas_sp.AAC.3
MSSWSGCLGHRTGSSGPRHANGSLLSTGSAPTSLCTPFACADERSPARCCNVSMSLLHSGRVPKHLALPRITSACRCRDVATIIRFTSAMNPSFSGCSGSQRTSETITMLFSSPWETIRQMDQPLVNMT